MKKGMIAPAQEISGTAWRPGYSPRGTVQAGEGPAWEINLESYKLRKMGESKMDIYRLHKSVETEMAIRVSEDGKNWFWLPTSQLGDRKDLIIKGFDYVDVEIPDWLAKEHGLV